MGQAGWVQPAQVGLDPAKKEKKGLAWALGLAPPILFILVHRNKLLKINLLG